MKKDLKKEAVNKPEIKNSDVTRIMVGLSEIGKLDIDDFETNHNISKNLTSLSVVEKSYGKTIQSLMKKHIEINEQGQYASEQGAFIFKSKKDREDYESAYEKISNENVKVELFEVKLSIIKKVKGLKGTMMAQCHELIDENA